MPTKAILIAAGIGLSLLAGAASAAAIDSTLIQVAREAGEKERAGDKQKGRAHEDAQQLAREAEKGDDRGRKGRASEQPEQLAREAQTGDDRGRKGRASEQPEQLAREAQTGDDRGRKGRASEQPEQLAREAQTGDDRGRKGRASENPTLDVLAREASEGARGQDNNNHRRRGRG